ncbi:Tyrosine-type recombinase/integrase (plasmid) [Cupriavidus necator H16]|uniref:Integrase n=1 Tax=Cupriavidus necator (strain ATCC 17699 / DSM 428 / KCTC 22496 / NCIMB 10442 / H16 / Stanier 337) TaxID=381666 RepID=Q7WXR1_CUPNH|nr:tyrosine-type recombinase/integrase [Cupriavidus necator]AAP85810.1 putative integrase/recombinase [Cupriavidus necator H16]QCC05329.1 integrase [Cupriavidus necator H16]QQB81500.1 tyrosine-type recombinase/integrase [Cupriavidus necator]
MSSSKFKGHFQSAVGPLMEQFVQEKQACGYRYNAQARLLACFDRFLSDEALSACELPRSISRKWTAKRPHESKSTHDQRIGAVRQFALFMCRLGYAADVPDRSLTARRTSSFSPRILTHAEIQRLFRAADQLTPTALSPMRHLVMPEVLRLLYGCGLRVGEVLHLRVADVDLERGILTVRDGKFRKDRLVPPALPLVQRLRVYAQVMGDRPSDAYFFPSPSDGPLSHSSIYWLYRELLLRSGIPHAGRGKGPRVHDLRHAYAVHALLRWCQDGADLDAKLPVLATYMGHQSLAGTQRYLHLIAELFPEITARTGAAFGDVIPRRNGS